MIVRYSPSSLKRFFVTQGSAVPKIFGRIIGGALPHVSIGAMGIFGVALSLFLGFRNNETYDRWRLVRKLWGSMIADVRNLGRHVSIFVGMGADSEHILSCAVAFAYLHRGLLRNVEVRPDIVAWIGEEKSAAMIAQKNPAEAALRFMADQVGKLEKQDAITRFGQMLRSMVMCQLFRSILSYVLAQRVLRP